MDVYKQLVNRQTQRYTQTHTQIDTHTYIAVIYMATVVTFFCRLQNQQDVINDIQTQSQVCANAVCQVLSTNME